MYIRKKEKGITLIALAVTIIVMLILAGVTISTLISENGIITQGQKAKLANKIAQIREEIELAQANKFLEKQEYLTKYEIKDILEEKGEIERTNIKLDGMNASVEEILGEYSNKKVSKHVIAGYWENWVDNEFNGKNLK